MLHILLLILKIIGIVLLSVIGLLLLILLLILFVPFRYECAGDVEIPPEGQSEGQRIDVVAKVHWLLRVVAIRVDYSKAEGVNKKLRVAFVPISLDKKEVDEGTKEEGEAKQEESSVLDPAEYAPLTEADSEPVSTETKMEEAHSIAGSEEVSEPTFSENKKDAEAQELQETEEKHKKKGLAKLKEKVFGWKAKVEEWKMVAECMLELFTRKKGLLVDYCKKETTKQALLHVVDVLWWILKHIAPRTYEGEVTYGSGEPEMTGKIFAVAAVLFPLYESHLSVYPEFEEKVIKVKGEASGRIRLFGIIYRVIKLLLDKNFKQVLKEAMYVKDEMMDVPREAKDIIGKAA